MVKFDSLLMHWIQWEKTRITGLQLPTCIGIIESTAGFGIVIDLYRLDLLSTFKNVGYFSFLSSFTRSFGLTENNKKLSVWMPLPVILQCVLYLGIPQVFCRLQNMGRSAGKPAPFQKRLTFITTIAGVKACRDYRYCWPVS